MIINNNTIPLVINIKTHTVHYYTCKKVGYKQDEKNII